MGIFDRNTSTTINETTNLYEEDNAAIDGVADNAIAVVNADGVTVHQSDYGAIEAGSQVATNAINELRELSAQSMAASAQVVERLSEFSESSLSSMATTNRLALDAVTKATETASTGGESVVANSVVEIFKPVGYGLLAMAGVSLVMKLRA